MMQLMPRLLENGRIGPTPMTTHTFGFDDLKEAFRLMETKEEGSSSR